MNKENLMIKIWKFSDAPFKYQRLSTNGGDEDYVAVIPKAYLKRHEDFIPSFLESELFGCCDVEKHEINEGVVLIGCHA